MTGSDTVQGCGAPSRWSFRESLKRLPESARSILAEADGIRRREGGGMLHMEHLLAALYSSSEGYARRLLNVAGVTHGKLLETVLQQGRRTSPGERGAGDGSSLSNHLHYALATARQQFRETPLVLVVDDIPDNVEILEARLSARGYQVATAPGGAEALDLVERCPPDLILMDVIMPGIDGFEVTRRLKAHPRFNAIPVIIVTALSDAESFVEGLSAGAADYMSKPFYFRELEARIRAVLGRTFVRASRTVPEEALLYGAFSVTECDVIRAFAETGFDVWSILQRRGFSPITIPPPIAELLMSTSWLSASPIGSPGPDVFPVFYSAFISHASADAPFADRLHRDLLARGVNCWHYRRDMQGGKFWRGQIHEAIKSYEKLILICSENSLLRPNVIDEIISAIERERETGTQKLFPVRIDDFVLSDELLALADDKLASGAWREDWVRYIRSYHIPDFRDWPSPEVYHREFQKLLDSLTSPSERPQSGAR